MQMSKTMCLRVTNGYQRIPNDIKICMSTKVITGGN